VPNINLNIYPFLKVQEVARNLINQIFMFKHLIPTTIGIGIVAILSGQPSY
jgi:hypothetical protein